jgi:plastocyanin
MMKILKALSAVVLVGAVVATVAVAAPAKNARLTIRHQTKNCHTWALDRGTYAAHVDARLPVGGTITITNNDVMPHRLIEQRGPNAVFSGRVSMDHMGATLKVTFPRAGTYVFKTKAGEDYMEGVKTTGEDNVLTLKVVVR